MRKTTLLQHLSDRFPNQSKDSLYARVLCGEVMVNREKIRDPKYLIDADAAISFISRRFVSRGGVKLEHALRETGLSVKGKVIVDAGASTGGFTDCLLQMGASHVHAIDVGQNQIAYSLRLDKRVSVYEKTNIMDIADLSPAPEIGTADISFRTIRGVAKRLLSITIERTALVLVKPQFEQRRNKPGFRGVVNDRQELQATLNRVLMDLAADGSYTRAIVASPVTGRKGNREFFFLLSSEPTTPIEELRRTIEGVVP